MLLSETNHEPKWKKRLLIGLVVGIVLVFFIVRPVGFLAGLWLSERQKRAERTPQVKVPNVVGQDYRTGEATLQERGLRMRVIAKRWDQNQPVDIILDQVPFGSENVDLGYTVGVTIGTQPPTSSLRPPR